jgi:hypothetical protein
VRDLRRRPANAKNAAHDTTPSKLTEPRVPGTAQPQPPSSSDAVPPPAATQDLDVLSHSAFGAHSVDTLQATRQSPVDGLQRYGAHCVSAVAPMDFERSLEHCAAFVSGTHAPDALHVNPSAQSSRVSHVVRHASESHTYGVHGDVCGLGWQPPWALQSRVV